MTNKAIFLIFSIFFSFSAQALEVCGNLKQGNIVKIKIPQQDNIIYNGKKLYSADGIFLIAFDRDAPLLQSFKYGNNTFNFELSAGNWDVQHVNGLAQNKVTPSEQEQKAIEYENRSIRNSQKGYYPFAFWKSGYIQPVTGRISGAFGGQRIMNSIPKSPHRGTDIAAPKNTPVKAALEGKVVLAEPNLFYSGNVVIIDHGYGLHTIYAHLNNINVKVGEKVKKHHIIGTVGQTGRATGPHLHFGATLNGIRFDPMSLKNINVEKCKTF